MGMDFPGNLERCANGMVVLRCNNVLWISSAKGAGQGDTKMED